MLTGFHPWFSEELKRRINKRQAELLSDLGTGTCPDYAGYRAEVGRLAGLNEALDIADDIRKEQERQ